MTGATESAPANAIMPTAARSQVAIACGSAWTNAWFFAVVERQARLIATTQTPTSPSGAPGAVNHSGQQALIQLSQIVGRSFLYDGRLISPETADGDGTDGLALAASLGGPLRIAIGGPGVSAWAPIIGRAVASVDGVVALAGDVMSQANSWIPANTTGWNGANVAAHVMLVLGAPPDYSLPPGALAQSAATLRPWLDNATRLILLGSAPEEREVSQVFADHTVHRLDPSPASAPGAVAAILNQIFDQVVVRQVEDLAIMRHWTAAPVMSSTTALSRLVRFLAQRHGAATLALDVGATSSVAIGANAQGTLAIARLALGGVRQGAGAVARRSGLARVGRWLTEALPDDQMQAAILARMLHPAWLPETMAELALDQALAREAALALLAEGARPGGISELGNFDIILGTGGVLQHAPQPGQAALLLLDAVQPRGLTTLVLDIAGLAGALGLVSAQNPAVAAEVADMDALIMPLGLCVALVGSPPAGEPALRVTLEYADGHTYIAEILDGTIEALPLAPSQQAMMTLAPAQGVDVGLGPGQRARLSSPVEGGRLGIIVDARGRPLELPRDDALRRARLRQWALALGITT